MDRLRTFGIVAHIDAGKTTLTERILFDTGAQSWVGSVDDGTATMDFMPAERARGISITAAASRVAWGDYALQVVDTPGHVDFVAEVERCLRVIDGVVVLVDAVRGVESQTRAVWRQTVDAGVPRLVFVNKLDRRGAAFDAVLDEVREQLECTPVALVLPLMDLEGQFAGLGDALTGAVQWFEGRPDAEQVPALQAMLVAAHERLVEVAADHDPEVMAAVVAGDSLSVDRLRAALRGAFLAGELVPVLSGAALYNRGVDWLLDAVVAFLPGVADLPARGLWSSKGAGDACAPFCGLVFKVQHLDEVWNYLRIVRGRIIAGAFVVRGNKPATTGVVVPELWAMRADRHDVVASAGPGEIVVVPGDLGWRTGDTICDPADAVVLPSPKFPAPVLAVTFEPDVAEHSSSVFAAVHEHAIDDPTLRVSREHDRIVVRGMGELHLEVVAESVRSRARVDFRVSKPWVDRRESIRKAATGVAEVRAMIGGVERAARCELAIEPVDGGEAATIVIDAVGPVVAVAEAELRNRLVSGLRVGPLHGAVIRLQLATNDSDAEALIEQAASKAFENAVAAAGLIELEPWVSFEVLTPATTSAAVLADLGSRGGEVGNLTAGRTGARLLGRAPLSRMIGYVTRLRSVTKGLGQVVMRPDGFAEVP